MDFPSPSPTPTPFEQPNRVYLALCAPSDDEVGFFRDMCAPFRKKIEAAGLIYERRYGRLSGLDDAEDQTSDGKKGKKGQRGKQKGQPKKYTRIDPTQQASSSQSNSGSASGSSAKLAKYLNDQSIDLYELLELDDMHELATHEEIRKSYKRLALKYHPDKHQASELSPEEINAKFREVQEAYEILSDPFLRRQYDSTLPFDDTIPSEKQAKATGNDWELPKEVDPTGKMKRMAKIEQEIAEIRRIHNKAAYERAWKNFESLFDPVFRRNSKWSVRRPVPTLGDPSTDFEDIEEFYTFWSRFQTWREFVTEDEHDLSTAESRDEKRWMERQNSMQKMKSRNKEIQRLTKLAEIAKKTDPRFRWQREEERIENLLEERDSLLRQKAEEQRRYEERLKREAQRKEEEEIRAKEAEKEKQQSKKLRYRLKQNVVQLTTQLEGLLEPFPDTLFTTAAFQDEEVAALFTKSTMLLSIEQLQTKISDSTRLTTSTDSPSWQSDVTTFLSDIAKGMREQEAVVISLETQQTTSDDSTTTQPSKSTEWTIEEKQALIEAVKKYPTGLKGRWVKISEAVKRSPDECIAYSKTLQQMGGRLDTGASIQVFLNERQKHLNKMQDNTAVPNVNVKGATGFVSIPSIPMAAYERTEKKDEPKGEQEAPKPAKEKPKPAGWSAEEQKRLEEGLKQFPGSLGKERWDKIATHVQTKTKKECIARFKELAEMVKAKQAKN
ncbi:putative Chaperone protein DnaJ [Blattamonas nauphoetae]|uniref:Chaperone protein DnaJ n=1 Tax=Blattamonas nauphoetae TaxID=2049346 RepID=A0ABQ9Y9N2_9EUKA|nr:putative Chaperone protein DnaJ [Blattamonas nauphoetae]